MSSSLKDFGDSFARFQRRDDELGAEREISERREMQDPLFMGRRATRQHSSPVSGQAAFLSPPREDHGDNALGKTAVKLFTSDDPALQNEAWEYEEPPVGKLIELEESCLQGRGDLLHLVEKMIRRCK